MPKELKEILADLTEYVGDDDDKAQEAANEIHKQQAAVAQVLIDRGAKGKRVDKESRDQLKAMKQERDDLKGQLDELTEKLDEAQSKKPEEVQKLQREVDKLKGQVVEKETALISERTERKADRKKVRLARLEALLKPGQAGGVQEGYEKALAREYADRLDEDDEGHEVVRKIDDPEAVYTPAKGQDALELLAQEAIKKAPAWARLTGVEAGGGQGGGGGGGGGGKTLEQLKEEKKRSGAVAF
jgi:chromosome segregation ATPase